MGVDSLVTLPGNLTAATSYDCHDGVSSQWEVVKRDWCCMFLDVGCQERSRREHGYVEIRGLRHSLTAFENEGGPSLQHPSLGTKGWWNVEITQFQLCLSVLAVMMSSVGGFVAVCKLRQ